jgi:predicted membrane-bound dolichyl-phosphate-mannose-protein mannosyltransferase
MRDNEDTFYRIAVFASILFMVLFLVGGLLMLNQVRAEDNKTIVDQSRTAGGFPKILDSGKWSTQLLWDTTNACYQGTIRWIVMTNPSLLGHRPNVMAQREMVVHCFCVVDKIRKELTLEEYIKMVRDPDWSGNIFMTKAMECVREWQTLPLFFKTDLPSDNETITRKQQEESDNGSGTSDSIPEQPNEPLEEAPQLNF